MPSLGDRYSEDALIARPAIALFAELGCEVVSAFCEFDRPGPATAGLKPTTVGPSPLGREARSEVVLVQRLRAALERLNPGLPEEAIEQAIAELVRDRSAMARLRPTRRSITC